MKRIEVSRATLGRIPIYLKYLNDISELSENISATAIAKELDMGEVQVRKDLAALCGAGKPKIGYKINELISSLEEYLELVRKRAVIVGAGKIGRALYDYGGFEQFGQKICAAFDCAVSVKQESKGGKSIYPMKDFKAFCNENKVEIGIIAVPSEVAQEICDLMINCGIRGIWCFAPCKLNVPENTVVQYENMALSLAYLANSIN